MRTKILGRTGLRVSIVGLGGANLGLRDPNDPFRQHVLTPNISIADVELGIRAVHAAVVAGATLIDTAPKYEAGGSELIIAEALSRNSCLPYSVTVTTKIGCIHPGDGFDHSYGKAMKSIEGSMKRLRRNDFDLVYLHDPMDFDMNFIMGSSGSMQALRDLRDRGTINWIGIAANDPEIAADYIETGEFDAAAISGAWSLINQKASQRILPAAIKNNVGIVITTGLERGILVHGPLAGVNYLERKFSPECVKHILNMKAHCDRFGVPLVAAALQWCSLHPQVATVIPGARTPTEAAENIWAGCLGISEEFWTSLVPFISHFVS